MPYIEPKHRKEVDELVNVLARQINIFDELKTRRDGVLNYIVSRLITQLYGVRYTELNAAIGVLECIKLELYRRVAAPYEDKKKTENGEVYERGAE